MKKCIAIFCLVFIDLVQATPTIGGGTLLGWLQSRDERDGAMAVGYIGAVREMTFQKEHCATVDVNVPAIINAVRKTLEGMPQYRHLPASWIVIEALKARWPCSEKGQGIQTN